MSVEFNIIDWYDVDNTYQVEKEDDDDKMVTQEDYLIHIFGRTEDGRGVDCEISGFKPFYYVKIPKETKASDLFVLKNMINYMKTLWKIKSEKFQNLLIEKECKIVKAKDIYGFNNGEEFRYIKYVFSSKKTMNSSRYFLFKNPVKIPGINIKEMKFQLYESNFLPYMRFAHINNIKMAGWVEAKGNITEEDNKKIKIVATCNNVRGIEKNIIAPFVQFCWDIEVYSHDYTFPDPKERVNGKYPNEVYQIGITVKTHGSEHDDIKRIMLCTKKCNPIKDAIVIECKTERELFSEFIKTIQREDPDVFFGYNSDSFDFDYVIKRAEILGNDVKRELMKGISRNQSIPCVLKKEMFSSSAYGDSLFDRLYIPGRLNYDLLIHYKRGMKKYSSYKLDNIAKEILNDQKHEIQVKEIFQSYESNDPERVRVIAEYCIQDTELLQRLVDKQIILINIIQMANVTWVPIGFLVTRGQTVKVLSQVMRKASEMGYLVPHTAFNSNTNLLTVKLKKEYDMEILNAMVTENIKIDCGTTEFEWEGKKIKKDYIINGKVEEIINSKTINILTDTCLEDGEVIRYIKRGTCKNTLLEVHNICMEESSDSFTGATVLEPIRGIHMENIVVLDFASLYPTIMISRNLCFSSLVDESEWSEERLLSAGIKYEKIEWLDTITYKLNKKCKKIMSGGKRDGEECGKDAKFLVNEFLQHYCESHKTDLAVKIKEEFCENEKANGEECGKKAKWTDGVLNYCTKCKNMKTDDFIEIEIEKNKCACCSKTANYQELIKGECYFCLIHDPHKKDRKDEDRDLKKDISYRYLVVQCEDGKNKGVIPALLEDLYKARKDVKKEMFKQKDNKVLCDILDMQQLAIKVGLNSVYGFVSRNKGNLVKGELGKLTTSIGRSLIEQSKKFVEEDYNTDGKLKDELEIVEVSQEDRILLKRKYTF